MDFIRDIIPPFDLPMATILLYLLDWAAIVALAGLVTFYAIKARDRGRTPARREDSDQRQDPPRGMAA